MADDPECPRPLSPSTIRPSTIRPSTTRTGTRATLPDGLYVVLDGAHWRSLPGFTLALASVDPHGRVHTSLLGLGEVLARSRAGAQHDSLRFALWPGARSVAYLARCGRATLSCVFDATFFQIHLDTVERLADAAGLARFNARVEQVEAQRVAYAALTSGISYTLIEDAATVDARKAEQIAALRAD